jgi:two-component system sensor histidine kinase YesM
LDSQGEGKSKKIRTFLMNKMAERNEIQSIHIIQGNEALSEYKRPVFDRDPQEFLRHLELGNARQKSSFYWGIGKDSFEIQGMNTFYLVGSIRSKRNLEHLGYLIVFLDPNELQKSVNFYFKEMDYEVLVRSDLGKTISFPESSEIVELSDKLVYREEAKESWWQVFDTHQYSSQKMENIQGEIYGMTKQSQFRPSVEFVLVFMLIITMEFIVIASGIIKKRVTSPLEEIAAKAREIGVQGNLSILFPKEKYYSEADDISRALNEMMEQIRTLVLEVEQREKLQKKLELSVINHQIKPHFLYNTLNAVSILVSVEEKASANQLIKSLAKYYRACLNQGKDMITLDKELEIVREYIEVALIRNPDILRVAYDIDGEVRELQIPKMTLQTLVENCIKYGIKQMGEPIRIAISAKLCNAPDEGESVELCVEDNGSGMKQEVIDKIMRGESLEAESGFGVRSVVTRISLLYEIRRIEDIIRIESEEGEFTKVILRIPFVL